MTTMTTERDTLPMAVVRRDLCAGLESGTTYPYLAVDTGAPAGYSGCIIMPAGTAAGWAIQRSHPAALHPYIGMQGWWVRAADIEVTDVVSDIERPVLTGDERIPAQYRSEVPDGAYWARTTRTIDGLPQMDEVLALDVGAQGPLLLFWPGHDHFRRTTAERPSLPVGWHGWWAHGYVERIGEVARGTTTGELVDRPDLPIETGTRVRVLSDHDQPTNNGSLATVIEHVRTDRYAPFRVRYDADAPHATENQKGTHGWWVNEVVAVAEAEPTFPHADRFPVGDWYSWGTQTDWYRISEVRENSVCFDQYTVSTGSIIGRNEEYTVENMDRFHNRPVHFPPGHASLPEGLRRQTTPPEAVDPEPVAEHVYTVGERVEVIYGHGWDGPGTVREVDRHDITVEVDHSGRRGCFTRDQIRPLDEPTVDPMVPPFVPEGARRVRFTGRGAGRVTSGNEYMAIRSTDPGETGMDLLLAWPGHPEHATMAEHENRRGVPEGWKSFRSGSTELIGAWEPTPAPTPEPTVLGYEGVPEEHWASVPEGAVKVRHSLTRGPAREWMAIPYSDDRRMHLLIAWPGHDPQLGVSANNEGRLRQGVPRDWTSWAVTLRTDENLGAWPRIEPTVAEDTDEVARLRAELAATQRRYDDDLARIAEIMKDEADRREWCGEYEEVSQRINRSIHGTFNGERPQDYQVLFSGQVPFDGRVTLSLPSDPTEEQVKDALMAYLAEHTLSTLVTAVDYTAVDVNDLSVDEYDVQ